MYWEKISHPNVELKGFQGNSLNDKMRSFLLWTELCTAPPPHSYVEALYPNATLFGDRAFKKELKFNED